MDASQPNFIHISQALHTAAEEFIKCPNIPALQQGAEILQALNGLTRRLETMEQNMNRRFNNIERRLDNMDKRLDNMDKRLDNMDKRLDEFGDSGRAR